MCELCKLALINSVQGRHLMHSFNSAILLMLFVSFGILLFLGAMLARARWKTWDGAKKSLRALFQSNPYFSRKKAASTLIWGIVALMVMMIVLTNALVAWLSAQPEHPPTVLPIYGKITNFSLVDENGRKFSESSLRGKIWIADFFVSRCKDECPLLTDHMAQLQRDFSSDSRVALVSISIDPRYDTPKVLAAYSRRFGARNEKWYFLTGSEKEIVALMETRFHLPIVQDPHEKFSPKYDPDIAHSLKFVLVDGKGRIREYYDGNDLLSVAHIPRDVTILEREKPL